VVSDNEELNNADPVITHIPLKPNNQRSFSPNNGGVLFVVSILEDGERKPIAGFAGAREPTTQHNAPGDFDLQGGQSSGVEVRTTMFGAKMVASGRLAKRMNRQ
jgi:hypothetical protein